MKVSFTRAQQENQTNQSGFKTNYAKAKRGGYRLRWYLVVALVLSPLILVSWFFGKDLAVVRAEGVLTMAPLTINSPIDGKIEEVWVKDEQGLTAGQAILRFSSAGLEAQKALLSREITQLEEDMQVLQGSVKNNLMNSLNAARENQEMQQQLKQEYLEFQKQGLMSLDEIATLQNQHFSARQGVFNAQQQLSQEQERLLAGSAKQWRNQLQLQLLEIKEQIEQHTLTSPYPSKIAEMLVQPGQFVEKGTPLFIIAGKEQAETQVYLAPKYIEYGQIGRTATVTLPNGDSYLAKVSKSSEITRRIPEILSGPFEGAKPALRISLSVPSDLKYKVEGLPVTVRFHYINRQVD
ncbi:biotin/lipoyl-binding protein [Agarivorans sp. TSD2052]|uniref:HlyD family secretion protein n=1 Tax=Agarivorans sp. TSD2052 TaxID=2937286 RepID=UPI00200D5F88|nr:biotin/lipoyl-binding protein [Agarivorans sp. TSD2052]UPW19358.1 biotin/lipoyl-binding protein [Agarivorans sp. TSD2052]